MSEEQRFGSYHVYDIRLESYKSFFDSDWVDGFLEVSDKTQLGQICYDLGREWEGTSFVYMMPWLIIHSLENYHNGFWRDEPKLPQEFLRQFIDHVAMHGVIRNMAKKTLMLEARKLEIKLIELLATKRPVFDSETAWNAFIQEKIFAHALTHQQGMAYGSVYYAYENFLQRCIEVKRSAPDYRAKNPRQLSKDFAQEFSAVLEAECVSDSGVEIARLVRNSLAHNGGRPSADLLKHNHGFKEVDSRLVIMPEHVKALFNMLKDKAMKIVATAAKMTELQI